MSIVQRLLDRFGHDDADASGSVEAEQAVVDLLELVMLVDRSSAESERARIAEHLDARRWPGGHNPYSYANEAAARARTAIADDAALGELLDGVAARLRTDDDRAAAMAAVTALAAADGTVDDREVDVLDRLRRVLAS